MKMTEATKSSAEPFGRNARSSTVNKTESDTDIKKVSINDNLGNEQSLTKISLKTNFLHNSKILASDTFEHKCSQENVPLREVRNSHADVESCVEWKNGNRCMHYSISIMCQKNAGCLSGAQGNIPCSSTSDLLLKSHRTTSELACMSVQELKIIVQDLARSVEGMSSKLVSLLLENDALQQESDARNVSIEQLLKLTWKLTENEFRTVQMSVILPPTNSEAHTN